MRLHSAESNSQYFFFSLDHLDQISTQQNTRSIQTVTKFNSTEQWEEYKESIPNFDDTSSRANTLLEHMNTTKDASDYLWYTFR